MQSRTTRWAAGCSIKDLGACGLYPHGPLIQLSNPLCCAEDDKLPQLLLRSSMAACPATNPSATLLLLTCLMQCY